MKISIGTALDNTAQYILNIVPQDNAGSLLIAEQLPKHLAQGLTVDEEHAQLRLITLILDEFDIFHTPQLNAVLSHTGSYVQHIELSPWSMQTYNGECNPRKLNIELNIPQKNWTVLSIFTSAQICVQSQCVWTMPW